METLTSDAQEGTLMFDGYTRVTSPIHGVDDCRAVNELLARVGDKWSMRVVMSLGNGPMRFNELRRAITNISQRMLTRTLRGLEREGLVSRKVTPSAPPRVDYELTAIGHSLLRPITALGEWAVTHREDVERARAAFDAEHGED